MKNTQKSLTRPLCIRSHEALPMTRCPPPPPPPGMHATPRTQTSVVSRPLDLAFVTVHWRWTIRRDGNSRAALHRHRAFLQGTTASKLQDALPKAIRCACPVTQGVGRTRVGDAARAAHDNVCGHGPDPPCTVGASGVRPSSLSLMMCRCDRRCPDITPSSSAVAWEAGLRCAAAEFALWER